MAKKRRTPRSESSLDRLAAELRSLNERRADVARQLRLATERLLSGESPFPWGRARKARKTKRAGNRRRKMSLAARKAISKAQKERWAKQRSTKATTKAK